MTRGHVLALCAGMPRAVTDYPFGDGVAVFKVGGRMFALVPLQWMIDHSYQLVVGKLPRTVCDQLFGG